MSKELAYQAYVFLQDWGCFKNLINFRDSNEYVFDYVTINKLSKI